MLRTRRNRNLKARMACGYRKRLLPLLLGLASTPHATAACDPRITGTFKGGWSNAGHAGSYWLTTLVMRCRQGELHAVLTCQGEDPVGPPQWVSGVPMQDFRPYTHLAPAKVRMQGKQVFITLPDDAKVACHLSDLHGVYRNYRGTEEIIFHDPSAFNGCDRLVKQQRTGGLPHPTR